MSYKIPFSERNTPWRGMLDLAAGRYPAFLFGGSIRQNLPVFHFHDVTPAYLEPYLQHLVNNNYRTVTSAEIYRFVKDGIYPGDRSVALCFDDAWSCIWSTAFPLLRQYNLTAITYVVPALVTDAAQTRSNKQDFNSPAPGNPPMATWPELREMLTSGVIDVQAHTLNHAMVFSHDQPLGFVTPDYTPLPLTAPLINQKTPPQFLTPADLGAPIYPTRSRCADTLRFFPDPESVTACKAHVAHNGGQKYFEQPAWEKPLQDILNKSAGRWETPPEAEQAVAEEIGTAREILNHQLKTDTVKHLCFPWAVAGTIAEKAAHAAGCLTAFADRLGGKRIVRAGDNPYRLMRLKHQYIFALPGQPRRNFFQIKRR